uniref:Solute carrier family 23 member 1-like n=2 Tax=Hirondellea gigas TaxID=1518452 RepID=A0A2P2I708_9CRUS
MAENPTFVLDETDSGVTVGRANTDHDGGYRSDKDNTTHTNQKESEPSNYPRGLVADTSISVVQRQTDGNQASDHNTGLDTDWNAPNPQADDDIIKITRKFHEGIDDTRMRRGGNGEVQKGDSPDGLLYKIEDNPPWFLAAVLGLQHYLTMVGSTITIPFILTPELCIQQQDPARGYILSTIFFVSGIVTFLQSTVGVRLPIVQGGTFAFFAPTLAILHTQFKPCSSLGLDDLTPEQRQEEWQMRMREVQGAIIVSSLFQIFIGFTGLIGQVVSVITPLAIVPTVALVGLALFDIAASKASTNWGIAAMTMLMMIAFSQYLKEVKLPLPFYKKDRGLHTVRVAVFGLFPVLLSILLSWLLCAILTAAGAFAEDSKARTDGAGELLAASPWIRVPYPCQWGLPTVSPAAVFGMLAGVLASIVESIGDYYACARLSGAPPPPRHAINRGIGVEGVGCLLAGLLGSGNGTTSYSENIGAIGLTKVGSRRVIQYGAGIMIICGVMGKFAAVFVSIPEPVVGGIFCVMFAMITAVGLSSLQNVDLNSSRNLFVLGFPIFFGLALPKWLEGNPDVLSSEDYPVVTQILAVLLKTPMFVGGFLGILLDNTIPGTDEERGLAQWNVNVARPAEGAPSGSSGEEVRDEGTKDSVYDFPIGMNFVRRTPWLSFVPFCPTFRGWRWKKCR